LSGKNDKKSATKRLFQ